MTNRITQLEKKIKNLAFPKKIIYITIEEDDAFSGRYQIISQVKGYPKWAESIEGDNGGSSFSSKKEALKFLPEIIRQIKSSNPETQIIMRGIK